MEPDIASDVIFSMTLAGISQIAFGKGGDGIGIPASQAAWHIRRFKSFSIFLFVLFSGGGGKSPAAHSAVTHFPAFGSGSFGP